MPDPFAHTDLPTSAALGVEAAPASAAAAPRPTAPRLTRRQVRQVLHQVATEHGARVHERPDRFVVELVTGHVEVRRRCECVAFQGAGDQSEPEPVTLTENEAADAASFFADDFLDFMRDEIAREEAEADEADRQAVAFERWGYDYD